jgi:hypothetical protein
VIVDIGGEESFFDYHYYLGGGGGWNTGLSLTFGLGQTKPGWQGCVTGGAGGIVSANFGPNDGFSGVDIGIQAGFAGSFNMYYVFPGRDGR